VLRGETPSLAAFCARLKESRNLVVLTGAGISVAAGIPDFRSTADSIFSRGDLAAKYGLERPEDIFDIDRFRTQPEPFFELSAELMAGAERRPTVFHVLLRLLQDKGVLRRVYTQNIDTLERSAGLRPDVLIEAHGSYATSTCLVCGAAYDQAWLRAKLAGDGSGSTPHGGVAAATPKAAGAATAGAGAPAASAPHASPVKPGPSSATATAGAIVSKASGDRAVVVPRSIVSKASGDRAVVVPRCDAAGCSGVVKPDITFYGENLPAAYSSNVGPDTEAADVLIVAGSSLKVMPVAKLPDKVGHLVPRLLINREAVSEASGPPKPQPAKAVPPAASEGTAAAGGSPTRASTTFGAAAADLAASAASDPAASSTDAAAPRDEEWAAAVDFIFKGGCDAQAGDQSTELCSSQSIYIRASQSAHVGGGKEACVCARERTPRGSCMLCWGGWERCSQDPCAGTGAENRHRVSPCGCKQRDGN